MLQKIRDRAHGVFAWVILILICVPFTLWGIQNYLDVSQETPVVTVGGKDFFQRDVNQAYAQFSQNYAGMNIDEALLKKQAMSKLISDEVLLQYVQNERLNVTDTTVREFIASLQYFQVDGKFDKKQYQALLTSQNISSAEFVARIRNALIMEQFQRSIIDSGFVTNFEIENFFKLQNQQRDIEYVTVKMPEVKEKPSEEEVNDYYHAHQDDYRTAEQISIEYIDLSLAELAKDIESTEEQLRGFYEEQKDAYTTRERRKISHILFSFNANAEEDNDALEKALQAQKRLENEEFSVLAKELSDDKLTATKGGDLGLFNVGDMEPAFEAAALSLQADQVSSPVKSAFGYHLIKVTELTPGDTKPFSEVKDFVRTTLQKAEAEELYYELGETLTELSYENADNLAVVSEQIGIVVEQSKSFMKDSGTGIAAEEAVRAAAFSEEVLQGNNSEPVELGDERMVVLRMLEYKPASVRELSEVREQVSASVLRGKAEKLAAEKAGQIKQQLQDDVSFAEIAEQNSLELQKQPGLTRNNSEVSGLLNMAVFKAARPEADSSTNFIVALPGGDQAVVSLLAVEEGLPKAKDEKQQEQAETNIAKAMGQASFNSVLNELKTDADINIRINQP
ncbi:MAG: SurA N-terminal domain-containing protein [Methylococcales bacterium]|nr:SurA N-terminal domain-containing protein [Methylococcales bacterium]